MQRRVLPASGVGLCLSNVKRPAKFHWPVEGYVVPQHICNRGTPAPPPLSTQFVQPATFSSTPSVQPPMDDSTTHIDTEAGGMEQRSERTLDESLTRISVDNQGDLIVIVRPRRLTYEMDRWVRGGGGGACHHSDALRGTLGVSMQIPDVESMDVVIAPTEAIETAPTFNPSMRSGAPLEPVAVSERCDVEEGDPSCYICLETEDALSGSALYHSPCLCTGSSGFVHASCLQRQVTEMGLECCTVCRSRLPVVYSTKPPSPGTPSRNTRACVTAHRMECLCTMAYCCVVFALLLLISDVRTEAVGVLVMAGLSWWVCIRFTVYFCSSKGGIHASAGQGEEVLTLWVSSMRPWRPSVPPAHQQVPDLPYTVSFPV